MQYSVLRIWKRANFLKTQLKKDKEIKKQHQFFPPHFLYWILLLFFNGQCQTFFFCRFCKICLEFVTEALLKRGQWSERPNSSPISNKTHPPTWNPHQTSPFKLNMKETKQNNSLQRLITENKDLKTNTLKEDTIRWSWWSTHQLLVPV